MTTAILFLVLGQQCNGRTCATGAYVAQSYATTYTPAYTPVVFPIVTYAAGTDEKIELLTTIAQQNQQILAQQTEILKAVSANQPPPSVSSFEQKGRAVLNARCINCHSGPQPKAGLDLSGAISRSKLAMIVDKCSTDEMPPVPEKPLSDDELQSLASWLDQTQEAVRAKSRLQSVPAQDRQPAAPTRRQPAPQAPQTKSTR